MDGGQRVDGGRRDGGQTDGWRPEDGRRVDGGRTDSWGTDRQTDSGARVVTPQRQELEAENKKLRSEVRELREAVAERACEEASCDVARGRCHVLVEQLRAVTEELDVRKEEVLLLRAQLVKGARRKMAGGEENPILGSPASWPNSDKDVDAADVMEAYQGICETNRLLEAQLQEQRRQHREELAAVQQRLEATQQELEEQHRAFVHSAPEARVELGLQLEISRLTHENLDLKEVLEKVEKNERKLRKQLKIHVRKAQELEASSVHDKAFHGMLAYDPEDEALLIRNLITELEPQALGKAVPCLPAYVLFMCIRRLDHEGDERRLHALLTTAIHAIKRVLKVHAGEFTVAALWLANACRLLHCIRQYGGDTCPPSSNTRASPASPPPNPPGTALGPPSRRGAPSSAGRPPSSANSMVSGAPPPTSPSTRKCWPSSSASSSTAWPPPPSTTSCSARSCAAGARGCSSGSTSHSWRSGYGLGTWRRAGPCRAWSR
ncbi:unconventional myosin-Vb-like [Numida meleagris]|uniref:unconventional myosin-Vb-like n=1 Tax=Numida meleagris TaxID=8996 RepID=UPI000B3E0834|nr:unconventional myosin-Vb-like [Numida meleagris]